MPIPFQSASWKLRSTIPSPTLFGPLSGSVQGVIGSGFHKESKVVQTYGPLAHTFATYFGAAQASLDEGKTWFSTYQGTGVQEDEFVIGVFSLDTPSGTYHYQVRAQLSHSFFVADGSLSAGGIKLYATDFADGGLGTAFAPVQSLYSWPNVIADPANTGGNNVLTTPPVVADPIMIPGSGPSGEDAFWMAVSFSLDFGGTNNRQSINRFDLWRSLDGFSWQSVRDLTVVSPFDVSAHNGPFFQSATGRLFLGTAYTNTHDADLLTTGWTLIGGLVPFIGNIIPMYGGTLSSYRNGSLISGGFALVSCDDGGNLVNPNNTPVIPINATAFNLKLGPSEVILICPGFVNPSTQTVCYYSSDGGETWQGGEVWLASGIGERPVGMFLKGDGRPLVITTQRAFISNDTATGIPTIRTVCPLANAGLARAKRLDLCGGVITPDCQED